MRQVIFTPDDDPDRPGWIVECPSLPGCISEGDTFADALTNIKEAIALYIEVRAELGRPVPPEVPEPMGVQVVLLETA